MFFKHKLRILLPMPVALDNINASENVFYARRRPEKTTLYQTVIKHMNSVFQQMEMQGKYLPSYVQEEFDSYLDCGILSKGFLRLRCADCQNEKLVAFSCKKRGLCPSCGGRRMCDTAAHLVDNVFPEVKVRQWVVTFPFNLRYLFAYNKKALSKALETTIRAINRYYINRGKEMGVEDGKAGSVTLVQRFGSALNLNVHFHILFPDGVWSDDGKFHPARPPQNEDIDKIVCQIKERVPRTLERQGYIDGCNISDDDELAQEFPGLSESASSSVQRKNNQGKKIDEIGKYFDFHWASRKMKLCSEKDGFSLHGNTCVPAHDRQRLEQLCRYVARPAIAINRLTVLEDGNLLYKLKTPFKNGTTHLKFTPEEFIQKLIPLVPPPRLNLTRYHGALGPNSKLRNKVVIKKKKSSEKKGKISKYKIAFAKLLRRVFDFEIEKCSCGGQLKILSAIFEMDVIMGIMKSLNIEVFVPTPDPPRMRDFFSSA